MKAIHEENSTNSREILIKEHFVKSFQQLTHCHNEEIKKNTKLL